MFSQILKSLREADGISQARFAQEIQFSQAAISAWENNTREPGIEALLKISRYFNVTVDYLVGNSSQFPKKEKNSPSLTPDGKELLEIFNGLEPTHRSQILEYARYFAERNKNAKRNF